LSYTGIHEGDPATVACTVSDKNVVHDFSGTILPAQNAATENTCKIFNDNIVEN